MADRIAKFWLHPDVLYRFLSLNHKKSQQLVGNLTDYATRIRIIKQKEFNANKTKAMAAEVDDDATDGGVRQRSPQLFVNEMLKMYERGECNLAELDEQLVTMIVGVNIYNSTL